MSFWWDGVEVPDIAHVIYPVIPKRYSFLGSIFT